ncbi:MAG: RiPP maturation radical SAM C-methyltransferase [Pseudomonadota bacterium]
MSDKSGKTPVVLVGPVGDHYGMPSIAVSLLKASLETRGIGCRAIYANLVFYDIFGNDFFNNNSLTGISLLFLERLFAPMAHGDLMPYDLTSLTGHGISDSPEIFYDVLMGERTPVSRALAREANRMATLFLQRMTEKIVAQSPIIVGFSSTFHTTNSILAMVRYVKMHLPDALCVVGGNNCEGEMGIELGKLSKDIDYIFQGEADFAFASFCRDYLDKEKLPQDKIIACPPILDLNTLPSPDYQDFFHQWTLPHEHIFLTFESSRGCWWGHKHQCKFCGESALDLPYRVRAPERVISELEKFQEYYPGVKTYMASDSIFPYSYFKTFLPQLIESRFTGKLIYETKANLRRSQVELLCRAGVIRIMPGIESLSTRLLKLLNKGSTTIINIRLLRHCRELDMDVAWLLLMGIPGDKLEDYEAQVSLIPFLQHLSPPGIEPVRIPRNSPYFKEGHKYDVCNLTALRAYRHAFPAKTDFFSIAYFFTADFPSEARECPEKMRTFVECIRKWQTRWTHEKFPELILRQLPNKEWELTDTRDCALTPRHIISQGEQDLLRRCVWGLPVEKARLDPAYKICIKAGYIVEVDQKALSVVCRTSG